MNFSAENRTRALGLVLIFAAALWSAWSTLDRYFLGDDFAYVARFTALPYSAWPGLFINDWSGGIWGVALPELRPFAALTLMIDGRLWGVNPLGYHVTNLLLDAVCASLVAAIGWRVRPGAPLVGIAAGVLFALHPVHAECAAWITGRVDVLATAFYLGGFWAAIGWLQTGRRTHLALACAAYFGGVFSKEFCLTLPLLVVVFALFFPERDDPGRLRKLGVLVACLAGVFAVYALCRHLAFPRHMGNGESLNLLKPAYLGRQFAYIAWMFPPLLRTAQEQRDALLPLLRWVAPVIVAGVAVFMIGWRVRTRAPSPAWRASMFFGFFWYALATLPLVVVTYFSPRHLYFATAGFTLAIALVVDSVLPKRWLKLAVGLALVVSFASVFAQAVRPWRHSAKVSERLARALAAEPVNGRAWLLDVPEQYEGCWMWSWATPAALEPPFQRRRAEIVVERPAVYFAPHLWRERDVFSRLAAAPGAVLFSIDARGQVLRREITADALAHAARGLLAELGKREDVDVWNAFVQPLKTP